MPKPPSKTASGIQKATPEQANKLAQQLADKPYGGVKEVEPKAQNISISLPPALVEKLQDAALANKRGAGDLKTVSAIVRDALERAGY
jgi:hypothetical protein